MQLLVDTTVNGDEYPRFNRQQRRRNQSARRHYQGNVCLAALRAYSAAKLVIAGEASIAFAALRCGSNHSYVEAMVIVLKTEDPVLLKEVLTGTRNLFKAARAAKPLALLMQGLRTATPTDRAMFGRLATPGVLWDEVIVPAL